jgi:alanyl-tRNA synthetase
VVRTEEERFTNTLKVALGEFEKAVAVSGSSPSIVSGAAAFRLYDTYGLPVDFLDELAADRGLTVDHAGFDREMEAQRDRARQSSKMGAVKGDPVYVALLDRGRTSFLGYDALTVEDAKVLAVLKDGQLARRLDSGEEGGIVLDRTPFYAESGGQVGDRGVIASAGSTAEVTDCTLPVPGLYLHQVKVAAGGFEAGMTVRAEVDVDRRTGAMRHHTATHLLHAALRETLGVHVKQAGSLVAPDRLRFDFSHYA